MTNRVASVIRQAGDLVTVTLDHKLVGNVDNQTAKYSFFGAVHATGTMQPGATHFHTSPNPTVPIGSSSR